MRLFITKNILVGNFDLNKPAIKTNIFWIYKMNEHNKKKYKNNQGIVRMQAKIK